MRYLHKQHGCHGVRSRLLLPALLALALPGDLAVAAGPNNPFQIGGWHAGAYTDDQTGAFSHCAAAVSYQSQTTMMVGVTRAMTWSLGFANPQWSLTRGETVPVQLNFDSRAPYSATATVLQPTFAVVSMPDNSQLINTFRSAVMMTATARGERYAFRLDGTSQLLPALVNCVRSALLAEGNKPQSPPTSSSIGQSDFRLQEMQLATNFLLGTNLSNARVVSRTEAPAILAASGTAWRADDAIGAVKIYPSDQTGVEFTSGIISEAAKSCQGKFASARSSELVDSDVVFRAATSCADTQGERTVQHYILPWKKAHFAVFSVMGAGQKRESTATDSQNDLFKKAALNATHR
jgi:hypothetical protein